MLVSEESSRCDVSSDTFSLTAKGRAVLEELRAHERAQDCWRRYHEMGC
jgi:hypothetical protein